MLTVQSFWPGNWPGEEWMKGEKSSDPELEIVGGKEEGSRPDPCDVARRLRLETPVRLCHCPCQAVQCQSLSFRSCFHWVTDSLTSPIDVVKWCR